MNRYAPLRIFCLMVSSVMIFTSCSKPVSLPVPAVKDTNTTTVSTTTTPATTTSTPVTQLGKIIYYSILNNFQMATANYDGSDTTQISIGTNANLMLNGGVIKISSNNKTIYFGMTTSGSADNAGVSSGIYSCNLDGSNFQELLSAHSILALSLDAIYYAGSQAKILFRKNRVDGTIESSDIWTANLDGTNPKQISITIPANTTITGGEPTIISRDNKTIFFTLSSGNIYWCSINGGNATPVTIKGSGDGFPCGTYIDGLQHERLLFNNPLRKGLQTVNLDGTDIQNIAVTLPSGISPPGFIQVTPDSKTIFFSAISQTTYAQGIYSCNIDGSNVKPLLNANSFHGFVIELAF